MKLYIIISWYKRIVSESSVREISMKYDILIEMRLYRLTSPLLLLLTFQININVIKYLSITSLFHHKHKKDYYNVYKNCHEIWTSWWNLLLQYKTTKWFVSSKGQGRNSDTVEQNNENPIILYNIFLYAYPCQMDNKSIEIYRTKICLILR